MEPIKHLGLLAATNGSLVNVFEIYPPPTAEIGVHNCFISRKASNSDSKVK